MVKVETLAVIEDEVARHREMDILDSAWFSPRRTSACKNVISFPCTRLCTATTKCCSSSRGRAKGSMLRFFSFYCVAATLHHFTEQVETDSQHTYAAPDLPMHIIDEMDRLKSCARQCGQASCPSEASAQFTVRRRVEIR